MQSAETEMYIKEREKEKSLCFVDQPTVINYEKMMHMLVGEDRLPSIYVDITS